jgi:hypothetical protein
MKYIQEQIESYNYGYINDMELVDRCLEHINDEIEDDLGNLDTLIAIKDFVNSNDLSWSIVADINDCINEKIDNLK